MNYCQCERPRAGRNPDFCGRCLVRHDPAVLSTDKSIVAFLTHVAKLPGSPAAAIKHAQKRERAGRTEFGLDYIGRGNAAEGCEEAADGINYAFFEWLNDRRAGTDDIDPNLLDAAHHFAQAHAALERRRR